MTVELPAPVETLLLWPDGPPTVLGDVPPEIAYEAPQGIAAGTTVLRNISEPRLEVHRPAPGTSNGTGVIVIPGGGWTINMWDHEGNAIVQWLNGLGYTAFLLAHRVQASHPDPEEFARLAALMDGLHETPWPSSKKPRLISDLISDARYLAARSACADDGRRALELAREQAAELDIDPATIGMIGFSAGAFLAIDVALDPQGAQPAWIGAIYGGEVGDKTVPADAPPIFIAVAGDDVLAKVVEGLHESWTAADRPSEMHVFSRGGHGFGLVEQGLTSDRWTEQFISWLDAQLAARG